MNRIQKNDQVIVIGGKDKGKTGRIKSLVGSDRVIVENINKVKRHRKPARDYPGGIEEREAPVHISNVMLVDPKTKDPTRVRFKIVNEKKIRVSVKSGEAIG